MLSAPVLTVADVAAMLGCAETTVRERAIAGKLPGLKFGIDWVFPAAALIEALNEQAREAMRGKSLKAAPSAVLHSVAAPARPPVLPK
jgi:excisionase family DNA binding protein